MAYCFLRREGLCCRRDLFNCKLTRMKAESTSGHSERDMQRWRTVQEAVMMPMASWTCA
jgi:hypothetical protein